MKLIDPKNLNELYACRGKKCHVVLDTIAFPISEYDGLFTNVELDEDALLRKIDIEVEGARFVIPVKDIHSMSVEE